MLFDAARADEFGDKSRSAVRCHLVAKTDALFMMMPDRSIANGNGCRTGNRVELTFVRVGGKKSPQVCGDGQRTCSDQARSIQSSSSLVGVRGPRHCWMYAGISVDMQSRQVLAKGSFWMCRYIYV